MRINMKKFVLVVLSLSMLLSSSPWEGAATVAPDGELPAAGMFVATNSFPINTIVDITNIETNKSTRVIVARGLDSPGLLALVSREAAELIGMRAGSISRLRMVQPTDPIAYLRFIEGQSQGIHAFDSGNVITEETYREQFRSETTTTTPPAVSIVPEREHSGITGPSYVLEQEWLTRTEEIVTIRETTTVIAEPVHEAVEEEYEDYYYDDYYAEYEDEEIEDYIAEEPEEFIEEEYITEAYDDDYYDDIYDDYEEEYIAEEEEELLDEYLEDEYWLAEACEEEVYDEEWDELDDELEYLAEEIDEEEYDEPYDEEVEYLVEEEIAEEAEYITEYDLVPAEERPPELIYGIDPSDILPEVTLVPEPVIAPAPARADTATFSVPRVTSLDRGFYYVQIASFDSPESVERTLTSIDHNYRPLVYNEGDNRYRILLGPMNQGESAAVLARFKSIGYRDAFVRHER